MKMKVCRWEQICNSAAKFYKIILKKYVYTKYPRVARNQKITRNSEGKNFEKNPDKKSDPQWREIFSKGSVYHGIGNDWLFSEQTSRYYKL